MNLFSITSLIIFVSSVAFGLALYSENKKSIINKKWFVFSILIGLWSLGLFGVTWSDKKEMADLWQHLLDISAIMIPVMYFSFVSSFIGLRNKIWQHLSYLLAFLLTILSLTPYFKSGTHYIYDSFYWISPGPVYIIFPIYFLIYVIISLIIYTKSIFTESNRTKKYQIISMLIASVIGFGGGITNFLPQIMNIYPYGNFLVLLYLFFVSYGVLKFKFISKKILSVQLLVGATVIIFLFNLLEKFEVNSTYSESAILISALLLVLVSIFGLLIVKGVYKEVAQREHIEMLAVDLEKANQRLTELNRQKSEFVSFATHQLRAPLTAMKGWGSLLLEGELGQLPTKAKEGIERIYDSVNTMVNVVDDYLNISRIELGTMKYTFETMDLKTLIEDVVAELKPTIEKKGLKFTFTVENDDVDFRTTADRDKMKQVIINLIDNSVKYTPSGSVCTSLAFDKLRNVIIYTIKDTGIGIAPDVLPLLFQKFTRANNANRVNIKGTGLGLYVAKEIVDSHHGKLYAESAGEGRGSTFVLEVEPFRLTP